MRDKKPEEDRSKARKRAVIAGRVALGGVIVGLAAFFIYTNLDFFSFLGDETVDRLMTKEERPPAPAREYRSADEILGAPVFFERMEPVAMALPEPDTPAQSVQAADTPVRQRDTLIPPPKPDTLVPSVEVMPQPALPSPLPQLVPQPLPQPQIPPPQQTLPPPPPPAKPLATVLFTDIMCRLADREGRRFTMSLELSFENSPALREEIYFKRGMLTTIASSVVRRFEFGNVTLAALGAELLKSLNAQLRAGQLSEVNVKEFRAQSATGR
jgi:hypothetical protein